jgi:hypothetical protein
MLRSTLLTLLLATATTAVAQQPTKPPVSDRRIPIKARGKDEPKPPPCNCVMLPPDTVVVHDSLPPVVIVTPPPPPVVVHETTTDTVDHTRWVPVPVPTGCWPFNWGCGTRDHFFTDTTRITVIKIDTLPGTILTKIDTVTKLVASPPDTVRQSIFITVFQTDSVLVQSKPDTVIKYLPNGHTDTTIVYRDTCLTPPPHGPPITTTPEPGTWVLVASGFAGIVGVSRSRRNRT